MKTAITIGIVVMYHLTSEDIEKGIKLSPSKRYPAIINSIDDDGTCNLTVFGKDQRFDRSTKHFSDCGNIVEGSFSLQGESLPNPDELEDCNCTAPASETTDTGESEIKPETTDAGNADGGNVPVGGNPIPDAGENGAQNTANGNDDANQAIKQE